MELKDAIKKQIKIYWWNFGKKTLDFEGTYEDFFKVKDIAITKISKDGVKGLCFKIPLSCSTIDLKVFCGYYSTQELDGAIKLFLTYLGDKALFYGYNRIYKLNWN